MGQRRSESAVRSCGERHHPLRLVLRANLQRDFADDVDPRARTFMHFCHPSAAGRLPLVLSSSLSHHHERIWRIRYLRSADGAYTYTTANYTCIHKYGESRPTVSLVWGRGSPLSPRRRASLSLLFSSSSVLAPLFPLRTYPRCHFGIPSSRYLSFLP